MSHYETFRISLENEFQSGHNSPLASFIRNHFDIDLLQNVRHRRCSVSNSAPSSNGLDL